MKRVCVVVQMVRGGQWGIERSSTLADQSQGQVAVVAMFKVQRDSVGLRWLLISSQLRAQTPGTAF